ncbi:DEAD/DEAH box helicase family protein [Fulvivirga lutimaris]|uniref:DEAD/DEAH box helicase family protein n=1 Tax=Fulvivirga lutimaris TaxID=1819566 RepID=UPI0012BC68ED|nr:DEAD/DEAH box helicase family protein [Fulvivirga lutimaris]MTI38702.1 DEAD/DEAH box helicase [Fulvivirga lutimaris]
MNTNRFFLLNHFPSDINFKYPWRPYQERVLRELQDHLNDDHLHVIAPPGSGKTVLGLEVMLRLNKPTLILAPTIAIRNQWVHRFCELFLQTMSPPEWISNDIRNPKLITVATYQGIHAAASGTKIIEDELLELEADEEQESSGSKSEIDNLISSFKKIGLGTIVIDEAHHLKNAWWKTLIKFKSKLKPTIVGLTATPPYDVTYSEWNRYLELNGPVDTEIAVPELIREGDLCPHQDYVYLSSPSSKELELIKSHRHKIDLLRQELINDEKILADITNSPLFLEPEQHLSSIYDNMKYYSSILIYLNHKKVVLHGEHVKITGNQLKDLPKLNDEWLETFLDYYINVFEPIDEATIKHQKSVAKRIRQTGAIEWGKINLSNDSSLEKVLTSSLNKLSSICDITAFESKQLGASLRQVVLSDYIRAEYLSEEVAMNKMGVIPIFETLRRQFGAEIKLGVLTGSLVLIPAISLPEVLRIAGQHDIDEINFEPLAYDADYLLLKQNDKVRHHLVHIITQVFESGNINILVGTKSLLGEGWDAPSINSLILASYVGSFVLSNQMRGRAIRTQRGNKSKTSNIWHLACYDPTHDFGGRDIAILNRRFRGFLGISEREERTIENGLNRLLLPYKYNKEKAEMSNQRMMQSAAEREKLTQQWKEAITNGTHLVEEIKVPFEEQVEYKRQKQLYLNKTIKYVLVELGLGISAYTLEFVDNLPRFRGFLKTVQGRWTLFYTFLGGLAVFFGRSLFKSLRVYIKYRDIAKDLESISHAMLKTLVDVGQIHTDRSKLKILTTVNDHGEVFCHLEGGTTYEKSLFIESMQAIVGPVLNPRYIMIRKNWWAFIKQRDYHAVPDHLAKHKDVVMKLASNWRKFVGDCDYIYTRNSEGRALLLKARFNSLASEFQETSERTSRWK